MKQRLISWIFFLVVVWFLPNPVFANSGDTAVHEAEIRTLSPPEMPCDIRFMTGDAQALYLLDKCDTILRWDPVQGSIELIELFDPPQALRRIAVNEHRIAALSGESQEIHVYDKAGKFVHSYRYPGETRIRDIALFDNFVAVTTWYDEHLLFLFKNGVERPTRLILNPLYWPDASPRYRSEADVSVDRGQFVVVDRLNFSVYVIDPKSGAVDHHEKDRHPFVPPFERPENRWTGGSDDRYTGILGATSSAVKDSVTYLVMLDRRVTPGEPEDEYYLEIAASGHQEREWARRAALSDRYRFAGSHFPTIIGHTMYLFMPSDRVVHAVRLHD